MFFSKGEFYDFWNYLHAKLLKYYIWNLFCFLLRQGISLQALLAWNALCGLGWPWTHRDLPVSTSSVLEWKVRSTAGGCLWYLCCVYLLRKEWKLIQGRMVSTDLSCGTRQPVWGCPCPWALVFTVICVHAMLNPIRHQFLTSGDQFPLFISGTEHWNF